MGPEGERDRAGTRDEGKRGGTNPRPGSKRRTSGVAGALGNTGLWGQAMRMWPASSTKILKLPQISVLPTPASCPQPKTARRLPHHLARTGNLLPGSVSVLGSPHPPPFLVKGANAALHFFHRPCPKSFREHPGWSPCRTMDWCCPQPLPIVLHEAPPGLRRVKPGPQIRQAAGGAAPSIMATRRSTTGMVSSARPRRTTRHPSSAASR